MATVLAKVATVQLNLATDPAQMATPVQIKAVMPIKAVIKWMRRDGNSKYSYSKAEHIVEIV